ncbi:non-homologous end-joining factor 1 [Ambystoma mexicanum]|uniref:non-homologous end-joining factor 1 n=1 Tax=Ambystoma mexicanum TaxID=8296 RepID=UPI0037E94CCD
MEMLHELDACLLAEPWKSVPFGSTHFMAKVCFTDASYALLLTDLSGVWCEQADACVVQERSKELNKRLKAPVSSFLKHLSELMLPLLDGRQNRSASFTCEQIHSKLSVRVKSELSGLPFYWDFRCNEASIGMVSRHLLRPLMGMSLALERQTQELAALLLRKDAEIQDYKESGATLSRGRLETEIFNENVFLETFLSEGLPQVSGPGQDIAFTTGLQSLYTAITTQEVQAQQLKESGDSKTPDPASSADSDGRSPGPQTEPDRAPVQNQAQTVVIREPSPTPAVVVPRVPVSPPSQNAAAVVSKPKRKKARGLFN